jgi:nitroreductase
MTAPFVPRRLIMNDIIRNMLTRRSVRRYAVQQVSEADLADILTAAQYAPCGSNSQFWHFFILQDGEVLEELNQLVRNAFAERVVDENTYVSIRGGKEAARREDYSFHYHAPTLVVVTNRKSYPNAMADCACALENMQLAAHSLGLGSCWINQLTWFGEDPAVRAVLDRLGVPADEKVFGSLAIGHPTGSAGDAPARKGNPFVYIR